MSKVEKAILINALCKLVEVEDLLCKAGEYGKALTFPLKGIMDSLDTVIRDIDVKDEEETKE